MRRFTVRRFAAACAALVVVAGCSTASTTSSASPVVSPPPTAVATTQPAAETPAPSAASTAPPSTPGPPTSFTSPLYHYSVQLPGAWIVKPATAAWDGNYQFGHGTAQTDTFIQTTSTRIVWGMAAPTSLKLAAWVADRIAANARDHGDTCPAEPAVTEATKVDGLDAMFIAWDCGILINLVLVVDKGVGYVYGLRDSAVDGAVDPAARTTFDAVFGTIKLPS
jgi:hypothetical protein